jgi:hypothetical protein
MTNRGVGQLGYLTCTELLLNYALYCGLGYLAAGRTGAWVGAGLFTAVLVAAVVVASLRVSKEKSAEVPPKG